MGLRGDMVVTQANWLVEASQSMTVNEKRLVMAAAALHDPRKPLPPNATVTFSAVDFAEIFGIESRGHIYDVLRDAAKRLFNRRIREIREGKRGKIIRDTRWVWMAEYNDGEGSVTLGFSPTVVPYLTLLRERYTRYKLRAVGQLSSFHAIRLYELMAEYRAIGKREIELERLRYLMDLGDKYPNVKDLRRWVLEPSVKELNEGTDLRVEMTAMRRGRTVTGWRFAIRVDEQLALDLHGGGPEDHEERVLQGPAEAGQEQ